MVFLRDCAKFRVRREILQIRLNDWLALRQEADQSVFPFDNLIDNLVRADWSSRCLLRNRIDINPDREHLGLQGAPECAQPAPAEILAAALAQQVIAKAFEIGRCLEPNQIIGA